jgi:hypothetical protein
MDIVLQILPVLHTHAGRRHSNNASIHPSKSPQKRHQSTSTEQKADCSFHQLIDRPTAEFLDLLVL